MNKKKLENKEIERLIKICRETQMSDPEKCVIAGNKILETALKNNDLENEGIAYKAIGLGFMNQKKYNEAIQSFNNIISRSKDFSEFVYFIQAHNTLGHCYWRKGDKDTALYFFKKTLELNTKKNDQTEIAKDQINLGSLYLQMGAYEKSIEYTTEALESFKKLKNEQGIGFAYSNLGNCYHYLGKYEEGIKYNLKAISYAEKLNDLPFLGRSLQAASSLYQKSGKFKKAVECALKSLKIKNKLNENPINVLISLGIIYKEWNNSDKAMEYYKEALEICNQEEDEVNSSRIMNNIGNIYLEKKDNPEALTYFKKALKIFRKLDEKNDMISVLNNIGLIYSESIENWKEAEKSFNEAIHFAEELKLDKEMISNLLSLTDLYIRQSNFDKAERMLSKCNKYLENVQSYQLELNYFSTKRSFYEKQGNFKKAFFWLNKFSEQKDKIFNEESQKKIAEMQTKYETEQKEKEAEIFRLKTMELEKKNKLIEKQKKELIVTIEKLRKSEIKYDIVESDLHKNIGLELIGDSESIRNIRKLISVVAKSNDTNVLITGENGTGKEIVARQIHNLSKRKTGNFFGVNSSAIPETLFESEFFGYEKNAFTGANKTHIGWFEIADKGTLFLDEIGTMQLDRQVKFLRVLEERRIVRLGSHRGISVDVRIISATNSNLYEQVEQKLFREDLYHRLSTFVIQIPPLRERKEDIPLLLAHFVKMFGKLLNKKITRIDDHVRSSLYEYHFPGNVRELKNMVERAVIVSDSSTLKINHFSIPANNKTDRSKQEFLSMPELEKKHIHEALKISNFNQSEAAKLLKMDRKAVRRKMIKYGIIKD